MKTFPAGLDTLLATKTYVFADLYDFTLENGTHLYYTTADTDVLYGGNTYTSKGPFFEVASSSRGHWKSGLDLDTWKITILPAVADPITGVAYPAKIFNQPWIVAARVGALDGATVDIHRLYYSAWPSPWVSPLNAAFNPTAFPSSPADPSVPYGLNNLPINQANGHISIGAYPPQLGITGYVLIDLFAGRVAGMDISRTGATITINSFVELLQRPMPRNVYGSMCRFTLFDSGCQLNRASFAVSGSVTARTNDGNFATNLSNANDYFSLGMLTWTAGNNTPFSRSIRSYMFPGGNIQLIAPMPYLVQVGDTFTAYPGCNKTQSQCGPSKFNNLANFGGQPFIPSPESAV